MAKKEFRTLSFRSGIRGGGDNPIQDNLATLKRPKLKFNFTISFKLRDPMALRLKKTNSNAKADGAIMADQLTFVLKQASRPNPTVVYEDVNFYNYRTKVATKVDYGTMQIMLYDDVENFGHNLYEHYLKSLSPIASQQDANALFSGKEGPQNRAFNSQDVTKIEISGGSGSVGPLPDADIAKGGESGLIEHISIRHWYLSQFESRTTEEGNPILLNPSLQFIEYKFLNPKVINMTLDELDMTQSDVSTVMMNFIYDSVYINSPTTADNKLQSITENPTNTFTLSDALGKVKEAKLLADRVRRISDITALQALSLLEQKSIIPPITGTFPNIKLPKPVIDLGGKILDIII